MENYKNSKIGLETAKKYGDILEMERPQTEESLRKHPRMTLQNRAKIFSPFSPLRGYDEKRNYSCIFGTTFESAWLHCNYAEIRSLHQY